MMETKLLLSHGLAVSALAIAMPAGAHGLLVSVQGEAGAVSGRIYYSDGTVGAGEFVELRDISAPSIPILSAAADKQGTFRFPASPGHRYSVMAHGEEGHTTEMQLTLAKGERGRLIDNTASGSRQGPGLPPAWMTIGILLLLSAAIALFLRHRVRQSNDR